MTTREQIAPPGEWPGSRRSDGGVVGAPSRSTVALSTLSERPCGAAPRANGPDAPAVLLGFRVGNLADITMAYSLTVAEALRDAIRERAVERVGASGTVAWASDDRLDILLFDPVTRDTAALESRDQCFASLVAALSSEIGIDGLRFLLCWSDAMAAVEISEGQPVPASIPHLDDEVGERLKARDRHYECPQGCATPRRRHATDTALADPLYQRASNCCSSSMGAVPAVWMLLGDMAEGVGSISAASGHRGVAVNGEGIVNRAIAGIGQ